MIVDTIKKQRTHPFIVPAPNVHPDLILRADWNLPNKFKMRRAECNPASVTEDGTPVAERKLGSDHVKDFGITRVAEVHVVVALVRASPAPIRFFEFER